MRRDSLLLAQEYQVKQPGSQLNAIFFINYKAKNEEKNYFMLPFCKAQHQRYPTGPVAQGLFQLTIYENH